MSNYKAMREIQRDIELGNRSFADVGLDWFAAGLEAPLEAQQVAKIAKQYGDDLVAFAHDAIIWPEGQSPAAYQDEIWEQWLIDEFLGVRGPHGLGKTTLASIAGLHGILTADDVKVPTTASSWRQLTKFLWPEIHKWAARLDFDLLGIEPFTRNQLQTLSLKIGKNREMFAAASGDSATMEGAHAETLIYIYDEAKAIPAATFDATAGAFSGAGKDTGRKARALAISTPGPAVGAFYEICTGQRPGWKSRHVTVDEAIKAGRVSSQWVELMREVWGETDPRFIMRVLGDFVDADEDVIVIPAHVIKQAHDHWQRWQEAGEKTLRDRPDVIGIDVGRGGDRSALCPIYAATIPGDDGKEHAGLVCPTIFTNRKADTMAIVKEALDLAGDHTQFVVDVIGVGSGVFDRLRELGRSVVAFNASEKTGRMDESGRVGFANKRAAGWFNMRYKLANEWIALPKFEDQRHRSSLDRELAAAQWFETSGGTIQIIPKEEMIEDLGVSPDLADALMHALWVAHATGEFVV